MKIYGPAVTTVAVYFTYAKANSTRRGNRTSPRQANAHALRFSGARDGLFSREGVSLGNKEGGFLYGGDATSTA